MNEEQKNEKGRPFKMEQWLEQLNEVLHSTEAILYLTYSDLVKLVNSKLPTHHQITKRTFENWIAGKFHPDEEIGRKFMKAIELALINQKINIGERMMNDKTGQWTRFAWLLERKFEEFNLKHISENINKNEQTIIIQITAGNEEQKALIDSILNPDFIEIKPVQIPKYNESENEND